MLLIIEIVEGPDPGAPLALNPGDRIRIGRSRNTDLSMENDIFMSRNHAEIEYDGQACLVRDLNSSYGTFVNGDRIQQARIDPGDHIRLGTTVLRLKASGTGNTEADATRDMAAVSPAADATLDMAAVPARVDATRIMAAVAAPLPVDETHVSEQVTFRHKVPNISHVSSPAGDSTPPDPLITSASPFPVAHLHWRDVRNTPKLTIIAKASYIIGEGETLTVSEQQLPVFEQDRHFNDEPQRPVEFACELIPGKPIAAVIIVGRARDPDDTITTASKLSLRIGSLHRVIPEPGEHSRVISMDRHLRGGESVELSNHSAIDRLAFTIPVYRPRMWMRSSGSGGASVDAAPVRVHGKVVLDTLVLVPRERAVHLVYRAIFDLSSQDAAPSVQVTVV